MTELFISTFITFFVVIDPLGIAPIFAVMTDGASRKFKRRMVFKSVLTGAVILMFFAFLGNALLSALGISMDAFKAAGGFLLFMIALEMVFEKRTERRKKNTKEFIHPHEEHPVPTDETDKEYDDISVFPMAIPFIAGPGSIATIMLLMSQYANEVQVQGLVIGSMMTALLVTVVILMAATKIIGMMGPAVASAITRILGVLLAAMATQYMFDGIKTAFIGA